MPTTAQLYTITRDIDGRYRIVDARGEPVRDGLGIVSFARAAAARIREAAAQVDRWYDAGAAWAPPLQVLPTLTNGIRLSAVAENISSNPTGGTPMSYNDYTNYETWAAALWIDNDFGLYEWSREAAREELQAADGDRLSAERALADRLKSAMEEQRPDFGATLWSDLLNAAFGGINWRQIAENYVEEVVEEVNATEAE